MCNAWIMAKSTNDAPTTLPYNRSKKPFELIYSDLSGKQTTPSYGNSYYYITFIDDYTRMGWVVFIKNKSDACQVMIDFITYIQRQFNALVLAIMTDNGGEYVQIDVYFKQQGIRHIRIPPYSHQSNGVPLYGEFLVV